MPTTIAASTGKSLLHADRHRGGASPIIEPTEMSISPVMMMSVIGSATMRHRHHAASAIEMFDAVTK